MAVLQQNDYVINFYLQLKHFKRRVANLTAFKAIFRASFKAFTIYFITTNVIIHSGFVRRTKGDIQASQISECNCNHTNTHIHVGQPSLSLPLFFTANRIAVRVLKWNRIDLVGQTKVATGS